MAGHPHVRVSKAAALITHPTGTRTSEGFIPHLRMGALRCPVVLLTTAAADGVRSILTIYGKPVAKRHGGQPAYALPGGGEVVR